MNLSRIPRYANTLITHPEVFVGSKKYVFLIGHMRSFSTLLSHILGSSKDINGYRENHISYDKAYDLIQLRYRTYLAIEGKLSGQYVLDKILHNHLKVNDDILHKDNLRLLFTIRKPQETVKSIINMGQKMVDEAWYLDQNKVAEYYEQRLQAMCVYAEKVGSRGVYFDAEILIENPELMTSQLSKWLELEDPLKTEYKKFKDTGKPIHGDPSSNIMEGKIIKKKRDYQIELDPAIENRLEEVYETSKSRILAASTDLLKA